jgi:hypothetical protein
MKKTIEFDQECQSCAGTGLYVGMAERDGAAVVCHTCKGSGKYHFRHSYNEFEGRKEKDGVERVYQANPGICIGKGGRGKEYKLSDFGGMAYGDWKKGKKFSTGMENRMSTCPAWFYQSADSSKKPEWSECEFGSFSACSHFPNKAKCWQRFDKEARPDGKG